jgi:hypothetical protein
MSSRPFNRLAPVRDTPLFSSASITVRRDEAEAAILAAVQKASPYRLDAPDIFAEAVTAAHAPRPPVLLRDEISFRVFEASVEVEDPFGQTELRPGVTAQLHVPFLGPADYFDLWATTLPTRPPTGHVGRRALVLSLSSIRPEGPAAQKHFARELDRIDGMLDDQRRYCDGLRPELLEIAAAEIEDRRLRQAAVLAIRTRLAAEGYSPFRRRGGQRPAPFRPNATPRANRPPA